MREAHRLNVVHRDLKPGNIMLLRHSENADDDDFVKVLDFGLAKSSISSGQALTQAGMFLGSPRYVSPEQIEGKQVDPRAVVYSFGCVLYRMLTGRVPFTGKAPVEIMIQHLDKPPPPLEVKVPQILSDLVYDCLEKKRRDRPQFMDEVIERLKLLHAQQGENSFTDMQSLEMSSGQSIAPGDVPGPILVDDGDDELESKPTMLEPSLVRRKRLEASPFNRPQPITDGEGFEDSEVSWAADEELSLDSTRPSYVLQSRVRGVKRAVALLILLGVGGALAVAHQQGVQVPFLEDKGWPVPGFLAAETVEILPEEPPKVQGERRKVRVTARSNPPASVTLLAVGAKEKGAVPDELGEDLGISPIEKEFELVPGEKRILLFERKGHRHARAVIEGPPKETPLPLRLNVQVYLPKSAP
ncbi:MAG: serine/threonine protein kinase [Deltaproteobacteria bacterium]|nr:serine/threonine protein kinase [Deltaproteobacteria bacterium]